MKTLSSPGRWPHRRRRGAVRRDLYWPSTPILNRFIRKPMAAASAEIVDQRRLVDDVDHGRGPGGLEMMTPQKSPAGLPDS